MDWRREQETPLSHTCRLSKFGLAKHPNNKPNKVVKISRNVLGVFVTTTFQTWRAACLTNNETSERPMYKPARTLFRLSSPKAVIMIWLHEILIRNVSEVLIRQNNRKSDQKYFMRVFCSKIIVFVSSFRTHFSGNSGNTIQEVSKKLNGAKNYFKN